MTPSTSHDPPPAPGKLVGRLWVMAAALMWSSCGLFVKAGFFDDWGSAGGPLLAFWRSFFAAVVLLPMVRRPRFNVNLVPMTLCFAVMCITYLSANVLTTAANAIWLQASSPWWVLLLSLAFFREPVVRRDLVPLGFGVLGVGIILFFEIRGPDLIGVLCGLVSGVTFAGVILFLRRLRHENAVWLIALNHVVAASLILPWTIWAGVWPSAGQLVVLAGFGVFQMAIPYLLMIRGLRTISSQEAVAIALLEPVLNPLWVALATPETPQWWTIVGASLILAGLVLRYVIIELFRSRIRLTGGIRKVYP